MSETSITEQYIIKNFQREEAKRQEEHKRWLDNYNQRNKALFLRVLGLCVSATAIITAVLTTLLLRG